ncbi:hypothetical protein QZH41_019337 [Actinostola sp. cb2023]|nr:hypothetical protein QZH41_019337 [Actinostola sp. cb2023]
MTVKVELQHLLGLAIGTPEVGAVNFNILHGVVREILKHLAIDNKAIELEDDGHFRAAYSIVKTSVDGVATEDNAKSDPVSTEKKDGQSGVATSVFTKITPDKFGNFETKLSEIEKKLSLLDDLPSNSEVLQRAKTRKENRTPVGDIWQFININRRLGATETGIEKLSSLLDSMMAEINDIKELAGGIEDLKKKLAEVHVSKKKNIDFTYCYDFICQLEKRNTALEQRLSSLESVDNTEDKKKLADLLKELKKLKSQVDELPTKDDIGDLDIFVKWPQLEEALNARTRARTPTPKPITPTPTPPPRSPTPIHPSEDALEALRQVGELRDKHEDVVAQVVVLEDKMPTKANLDDLEDLKNRPAVPPDIIDQLKRMREAIDAIQKWRKEKTIPTDLEDQLRSLREGVALLDNHKNQINEMNDHLKGLRNVTDLLSDHNEKMQLIPDDLLEQLNKLKYLEKTVNQMSDSSHQLPHKLQRMEERFKDDFEREMRTLREGIRLLNNQFDKLKKMNSSPIPVSPNARKAQGDGKIDSLRSMLLELQSEQEKLDSLTKELVEEHNRKQKHIDALYEYVERLQEHKADKDQVAMEIDLKVDKKALDNLISRLKFDQSIGNLDQAIQDLLNRLEANEAALTDALKHLSDDVDRKLDRMEIDPLREYFEKKIKSMKCKHADLPLNEDPAAGFRKALLRFHCISCDRPVDMAPGPPNPALPQSPSLPAPRAARAYTTFELDQIRQMNRGLYSDQDIAMATARSCGGGHTVTYPHRRTARFNQYYYCRDDEIVPVPVAQRDETELVGHDGHIYRGRYDQETQQFIDLPPSPRQTKSARVTSAKRSTSPQPPATGSPRRPRSAVPSSPRSRGEATEPQISEIPAS